MKTGKSSLEQISRVYGNQVIVYPDGVTVNIFLTAFRYAFLMSSNLCVKSAADFFLIDT